MAFSSSRVVCVALLGLLTHWKRTLSKALHSLTTDGVMRVTNGNSLKGPGMRSARYA